MFALARPFAHILPHTPLTPAVRSRPFRCPLRHLRPRLEDAYALTQPVIRHILYLVGIKIVSLICARWRKLDGIVRATYHKEIESRAQEIGERMHQNEISIEEASLAAFEMRNAYRTKLRRISSPVGWLCTTIIRPSNPKSSTTVQARDITSLIHNLPKPKGPLYGGWTGCTLMATLTEKEEEAYLLLSRLFLDDDPTGEIIYMASALYRLEIPVSRLEHMLRSDLFPILYANIMQVAGIWGAFDRDWLLHEVQARRYSGAVGWLRDALYSPLWYTYGRIVVWPPWVEIKKSIETLENTEKTISTTTMSQMSQTSL